MRIHRLEIEGFGPFRTRQLVDFDEYATDGIFLIAGRTGAGKSSILDAICFALYGSAPRYDDGEKRLRSDHSEPGEPTEVAMEFTGGARTWRIERSPEYLRPKKRGDGLTPSPADARMFEWVDGEWIGRAARPVDVATLIDEVIGLTQQQFLQVILLAQGRFARFLLARNDERQAVLRTLFGTRRFEEYARELDERRKATASRLASENEHLVAQLEGAERLAAGAERTLNGPGTTEDDGEDGARVDAAGADAAEIDAIDDAADAAVDDGASPPASLEERIAAASKAALRARHVAETIAAEEHAAAVARDAADATHHERTAQREKQGRRASARSALSDLDARGSEIDAARRELERSRRAEVVRGTLETARRAVLTLDGATREAEDARAAWREDPPDGTEDWTSDELDGFAAAAHRRLGSWTQAERLEEALGDDERMLVELRGEAEGHERESAGLATAAAALPDRRSTLEEALTAATARGAGVDAARDRMSALDAQLEAARAVTALAEAYAQADTAAAAAHDTRAGAVAHVDALHRRRIAGIAGELATQLTDGDPCAVCGSTAHPVPATPGDEPIGAEAIDAAERSRTTAVAADEAAAAHRRDAELALRGAEQRAGGATVADLESARTEALGIRDRAEAASTEAAQLSIERAALDREATQLEADRRTVATRTAATAGQIAAIAERIERARAEVAAARGDAASVAERIARETRRASRATALADALRVVADREGAATGAAAALEAALEDSGFADAAEAEESLRDAGVTAAREVQIRDHETRLGAAKATLMELELEMLPDDDVDLAQSERALAEARSEWQSVVARRAAAEERGRALQDAISRAESAYEAIADLARDAAVVERLAATVAGRAPNARRMKLETFVLAAELEEIVAAANVRLAEMSGERYSLHHTDALAGRGAASGLGIEVMDRFTGQARPAYSLSGGETFLASLALALGLAEVVTSRSGGIRLDMLFIDEGFGALDSETLDVAMRTLDELRQGGRTVGVISHVEAMKDQIPAQLRVGVTSEGSSVVHQGSPAHAP